MATNQSLQIAPLWHFMAGRGAHEKTFAELKQHFGFAAIPTNDQEANSAWQLISVLTLNLMRYFQIMAGTPERRRTWKRTFDFVFQSMQTLRFELIQQPLRRVCPQGRPELRFAVSPAARKRIEQITADIEPGQVFEGKVIKIMNFGAFVTLTPGRDGLVHISQLSEERVENVTDVVSEGDLVKVKVLEVDKQGRIRLSMKAVGEND